MADNIKLITYAESNVTPQHDALMADLELPGNGIIYGAQVTIKNATTLHINAGVGVIYGREFEIIDSDITVPLSQSGTLQGQLYVHIELANSQEPAQLLVQTGTSLDPLADDPQMNIDTGTSDMQLATFTIDTSTLADLTQTFEILEPTSGHIDRLETTLIAQGLYLQGSTVEFPSDGTIVETYESGDKKITSFPSNGNIVETIKDSANATKYTITTSFPSDGTIVKKVEAAS